MCYPVSNTAGHMHGFLSMAINQVHYYSRCLYGCTQQEQIDMCSCYFELSALQVGYTCAALMIRLLFLNHAGVVQFVYDNTTD